MGIFSSEEQIACLSERGIYSVLQQKADILLTFTIQKAYVSSSHGDPMLTM